MKLNSALISEKLQERIDLFKEAVREIILPRNGIEETVLRVSEAEKQLKEIKKSLAKLEATMKARPGCDHAKT